MKRWFSRSNNQETVETSVNKDSKIVSHVVTTSSTSTTDPNFQMPNISLPNLGINFEKMGFSNMNSLLKMWIHFLKT